MIVGGFMIPWDKLRTLLPDDRWAIYGAGWLDVGGPAVIVSVGYEQNGGNVVQIGSTSLASGGKVQIGPYPLRGDQATAMGIPQNENIVSVVLRGQLAAAGAAGSMRRWTLWLRMTPRST